MDFFDVSAQMRAIEELLDNPDQRHRMATAAAQKADDYSFSDGLKRWLKLVEL